QPVIFGIRNDGSILAMIARIMEGDLLGEPGQLRCRLFFVQMFHRLFARCHVSGLSCPSETASGSASNRRAAARASSVTVAPASMRAISSERTDSSIRRTAVTDPASPSEDLLIR